MSDGYDDFDPEAAAYFRSLDQVFDQVFQEEPAASELPSARLYGASWWAQIKAWLRRLLPKIPPL